MTSQVYSDNPHEYGRERRANAGRERTNWKTTKKYISKTIFFFFLTQIFIKINFGETGEKVSSFGGFCYKKKKNTTTGCSPALFHKGYEGG
jgi:hypothetical protein